VKAAHGQSVGSSYLRKRSRQEDSMYSHVVRVPGLLEAALGFACEVDDSSAHVAQLPSKAHTGR
jgi:hypothetical protein